MVQEFAELRTSSKSILPGCSLEYPSTGCYSPRRLKASTEPDRGNHTSWMANQHYTSHSEGSKERQEILSSI